MGVTLCEVDGFSALHGVLTFCLLEAAVPSGGSLGSALSVEVEVEPLRFLSDDNIKLPLLDIKKIMYNDVHFIFSISPLTTIPASVCSFLKVLPNYWIHHCNIYMITTSIL